MIRRTSNTMLAGIVIALLGAGSIPGIARAEEPPTTEAPAVPEEESATTWDKTKEVSAETWDATKEGSAKAWDKTKEVSGQAWDATKEGTAKAWDGTKDMVQGEEQVGSETESDAGEESPATVDASPSPAGQPNAAAGTDTTP